jgi:hypothetical protein
MELHDSYSSNIIRVIRIKEMRWVGQVACTEVKRNSCMALVGKPE